MEPKEKPADSKKRPAPKPPAAKGKAKKKKTDKEYMAETTVTRTQYSQAKLDFMAQLPVSSLHLRHFTNLFVGPLLRFFKKGLDWCLRLGDEISKTEKEARP